MNTIGDKSLHKLASFPFNGQVNKTNLTIIRIFISALHDVVSYSNKYVLQTIYSFGGGSYKKSAALLSIDKLMELSTAVHSSSIYQHACFDVYLCQVLCNDKEHWTENTLILLQSNLG